MWPSADAPRRPRSVAESKASPNRACPRFLEWGTLAYKISPIHRESRKALPQGQLIRQLNPPMRGWANYYRVGVSHAVYERLDHLTWIKLRHWARWRHPRTSTAWAIRRYWHRVGTRLTFATSAIDPDAVHLLAHSEVPMTRHVKV